MDTATPMRDLRRSLDSMAAEETAILAQLEKLRCSIRVRELGLAKPHNLRSPVSTLPPHILRQIFFLITQDCWDQALVISHVYRKWRRLVLAIPEMWGHVKVCRCYSTPGRVLILDLFLERSKACLMEVVLDFHLWHEKKHRYYEGVQIEDQLDRIYTTLARWRILRLRNAHPMDDSYELRPLKMAYAPLLQILDVEGVWDEIISFGAESEKNPEESLELFEGGAPELVLVRLCGISCSLPQPEKQFKVQIENAPLARGNRGFAKPLARSSRFPYLAHLHRFYQPLRFPSGKGYSSLMALEISDLHLSCQHLMHLLRYFEAPMLHTLEIKRSCPISALTKLLAAPIIPVYKALRSLHLQSARFTAHDAQIITVMIPSIECISLDHCISTDVLLRCLLVGSDTHQCLRKMWGYRCRGRGSRGRDGAVLWPQLQAISLSAFKVSDFDVLCDIIMDRIDCGLPIKDVKLVYERSLPSIRPLSLNWMRDRVFLQIQECHS